MARGKKTSPEDIYKIMTSWIVTQNYSETARELSIAESTVEKIVKENKDSPEFVKLWDEKKQDFAKKAGDIIDKGMLLLERRFDRAIEQETMLDMFIDEIASENKVKLSQVEKSLLITKLRAMQLQDIKAITTAIGTLFDKKALADGKATERMSIEIKMPDGIDEYAE